MALDPGILAEDSLAVQLVHGMVSRIALFGVCLEGATGQWPQWERMAAGAAFRGKNGWWGTTSQLLG